MPRNWYPKANSGYTNVVVNLSAQTVSGTSDSIEEIKLNSIMRDTVPFNPSSATKTISQSARCQKANAIFRTQPVPFALFPSGTTSSGIGLNVGEGYYKVGQTLTVTCAQEIVIINPVTGFTLWRGNPGSSPGKSIVLTTDMTGWYCIYRTNVGWSFRTFAVFPANYNGAEWLGGDFPALIDTANGVRNPMLDFIRPGIVRLHSGGGGQSVRWKEGATASTTFVDTNIINAIKNMHNTRSALTRTKFIWHIWAQPDYINALTDTAPQLTTWYTDYTNWLNHSLDKTATWGANSNIEFKKLVDYIQVNNEPNIAATNNICQTGDPNIDDPILSLQNYANKELIGKRIPEQIARTKARLAAKGVSHIPILYGGYDGNSRGHKNQGHCGLIGRQTGSFPFTNGLKEAEYQSIHNYSQGDIGTISNTTWNNNIDDGNAIHYMDLYYSNTDGGGFGHASEMPFFADEGTLKTPMTLICPAFRNPTYMPPNPDKRDGYHAWYLPGPGNLGDHKNYSIESPAGPTIWEQDICNYMLQWRAEDIRGVLFHISLMNSAASSPGPPAVAGVDVQYTRLVQKDSYSTTAASQYMGPAGHTAAACMMASWLDTVLNRYPNSNNRMKTSTGTSVIMYEFTDGGLVTRSAASNWVTDKQPRYELRLQDGTDFREQLVGQTTTATQGNAWTKFDYRTSTLRSMRIVFDHWADNAGDNCQTVIQTSVDGSSWTTRATYNTSSTTAVTVTDTTITTAVGAWRYLRISTARTSGTNAAVNIGIRGVRPYNPISPSTAGTWSVTPATTGATDWQGWEPVVFSRRVTATSDGNDVHVYDFGSSTSRTNVISFMHRKLGAATSTVKVQTSVDGVSYSTASTKTNSTTTFTTESVFVSGTYRYIRLSCTVASSDAEIHAYAAYGGRTVQTAIDSSYSQYDYSSNAKRTVRIRFSHNIEGAATCSTAIQLSTNGSAWTTYKTFTTTNTTPVAINQMVTNQTFRYIRLSTWSSSGSVAAQVYVSDVGHELEGMKQVWVHTGTVGATATFTLANAKTMSNMWGQSWIASNLTVGNTTVRIADCTAAEVAEALSVELTNG